MSQTVIKIENLYKEYKLGVINHGTLTHDIQSWWARMRGKEDPNSLISSQHNSDAEKSSFLALNDITCEIHQGDRDGVIGKNGAGKSTLLKILSKVTSPTKGSVKIKGRVASLLEVGTGFHSELTGRENIYLNGAILGMSRREIDRKIDAIIDFAGIEQHVDTPVKRYSSGMNVRLGFAFAAYLEPEILVVDEVLAVGDAEFQRKALGKMDDVSKGEGRTILFVSHNMGAVRKLCNNGILLEKGKKTIEGEMNTVINHYLSDDAKNRDSFHPISVPEIGIVVNSISINKNENGKVVPFKPLRVDIEIEVSQEMSTIGIELMLSHEDVSGVIFRTNTHTVKNMEVKLKKGKNNISCVIKSFDLASGTYWLGFAMSLLIIKYYYYESELFSFDVQETMIERGTLPTLSTYSHVYLDHEWFV